MSFIKITEQPSLHEDLEQLSVRSLLEGINEEDQKVALAVRSCIPHIERLVTGIVERMQQADGYFISEPEPADAWGYWMLRKFHRLSVCPILI